MVRRRRWGVLVGCGLGALLAACGVAADAPVPAADPIQIGCFRPLDAVPRESASRAPERVTDVAQTFLESQNGALLPRVSAADGTGSVAPPTVARALQIRASGYGSSGAGGGGGADPLAGRAVWVLGYRIEGATAWSRYRRGEMAYVIVDAAGSVPLLDCTVRGNA